MTNQDYITRVLLRDWPADPAVPAGPTFINAAGRINNLLLGGKIASVAIIHSEPGATRSNHYHQTDWHFLHVLAGSVRYLWRPTGSAEKPRERLFHAGEMFFTPPMMEHATLFPEGGVLLSLARNSRDHASHEADLVRVPDLTGLLP